MGFSEEKIMFIDSEKRLKQLSDEAKKNTEISKKQKKIAQYYAPGREAEHRISRCIDAERVHAR